MYVTDSGPPQVENKRDKQKVTPRFKMAVFFVTGTTFTINIS